MKGMWKENGGEETRDMEQAWNVLNWRGEVNTDIMAKETEWENKLAY
jgi:hypothetical protein